MFEKTERIPYYRRHECWDCKISFIRQVRLGPTVNLSGEMSVYCPKCGKKSSMAYPAFPTPNFTHA